MLQYFLTWTYQVVHVVVSSTHGASQTCCAKSQPLPQASIKLLVILCLYQGFNSFSGFDTRIPGDVIGCQGRHDGKGDARRYGV